MAKSLNARAAAAKLSWQIVDHGLSLDAVLTEYFSGAGESNRGLIQELVYGTCRWYGELDHYAAQLLDKPIRNKDRLVHFVLLVGLYQLVHLEIAEHAAVSESVSACKQLQKNWAKNMINRCLRRWQRESQAHLLLGDERERLANPAWLFNKLHESWPHELRAILSANNTRPPMFLRVNRRIVTRSAYLKRLAESDIGARADPRSQDTIALDKPVPVAELPGFASGEVSVQDIAAQIAADILSPCKGDLVLDACAAPGGKAAHLLERHPSLLLDALDISAVRAEKLRDTFSRLGLPAKVHVADATQSTSWPSPPTGYDQILIDAPCSGTGVIRRHPDIKHHRSEQDIQTLVEKQRGLLNSLWPLLKPGGRCLYLTCSILPEENEGQIDTFLLNHSDAMVVSIDHPQAFKTEYGCQSLPGVHNMDGFYYSHLQKMTL